MENHRARTNNQLSSDDKRVSTKQWMGNVVITRSTKTWRRMDEINNITPCRMDTVEIRSAAMLPPDSRIRVSCHRQEQQHVKEGNTALLKCTEGVITQTADVLEREFGVYTQNNCKKYLM